MSLESNDWLKFGDILLRMRDRPTPQDQAAFLTEMQEYDILEIILLKPPKVGVDVGVKPYILKQAGRSDIFLTGQVSTLQNLSAGPQFVCLSYDDVNDRWYNVNLWISRTTHTASVRITALYGKYEFADREEVEAKMKAAFRIFAQTFSGRPHT